MAKVLQFPATRTVAAAQAEHKNSRNALVQQYLWLQAEWDRLTLDCPEGQPLPSQEQAEWFERQIREVSEMLNWDDIRWSMVPF